MRRIVSSFMLLLAVAVFTGCGSDSVTDPATDKLIGTWTGSKIGSSFSGSSNLQLEFKSGGEIVVTQASDVEGTYTTSSNSSDPDIRNIEINYGSNVLVGVYKITGNSMELELVSASASTRPTAELGIGSTGQDNVSILTK